MPEMTDLLSRLRTATEGSRELSDEVIRVFGWRSEAKGSYVGSRYWFSPDGNWFGTHGQPDPTRNLQDASELVPEGLSWIVRKSGFGTPSQAEIYNPMRSPCVSDPGNLWKEDDAATPALALCIATLLARQAEEGKS